jgi:coenzyme F420-dependent glucose-6-phosphate dehydrogenase
MWKGSQPQEYYTDEWHVPREMYEHGAAQVDDEAFKEQAIVSSDPDVHVQRLQEIVDMGATVVVVQNNSGAAPHEAIRVYGEQVLPRLR